MGEKLCSIKDRAIALLETGINMEIPEINSKELYELMDIIKDIEEAEKYCYERKYYKAIVEAMEKNSDEKNEANMVKYLPAYGDAFRNRMYYSDPYESAWDSREGRSAISRKNYMELKESNGDKASRVAEIKKWAADFAEDAMEMLENAMPEEKAILKQYVANLLSKLG